jgi:trehalose-phosphatase
MTADSTPAVPSFLPSALERWDEIAARLAGQAPALFVDYDGTLSPIAPRPDLATLPEPAREVLRQLARQMPVAVVTGRERENVAALVGLPDLIYVGNHGFDIAGRGLRHEVGEGVPERIARAAAGLEAELAPAGIDGLLIEPKRFSISVHFRLVDEARVPEIERAVDTVAAAFPDLRKVPGKKHLELRPRIDWDKGRAVLWILDRLAESGENGEIGQYGGGPWIPLYLGDDVTDEDAFRAISGRGVGILVGDSAGDEAGPRPTAAAYTLRDPDEARQFLERLAGL